MAFVESLNRMSFNELSLEPDHSKPSLITWIKMKCGFLKIYNVGNSWSSVQPKPIDKQLRVKCELSVSQKQTDVKLFIKRSVRYEEERS